MAVKMPSVLDQHNKYVSDYAKFCQIYVYTIKLPSQDHDDNHVINMHFNLLDAAAPDNSSPGSQT